MHSRLTDLGVAAIPLVFGLLGPGPHGTGWSLPLSAALSVALYWRRRVPFLVLMACFLVGLTELTAALASSAVDSVLPGFYDLGIIIAIYSAVAYGTRATRLVAVAGGIAGAAVAALVWVTTVRSTANELAAMTALFAPVLLAWAFGTAARTRRAYLAGLEDRAERLQREREALAQVAVAQERERIARELHDIIAHSVSLMVVQSDGADAAIEQENIGEARKAVAAIGRTGRAALTDLRLLLGILRSDHEIAEPQPGIEQLQELIGSVPLQVRLRVDGEPRELPQGLALAVFRIVQEALTNTVKHAGPEVSADVRLRYSSNAMEVEVSDDGPGLILPSRSGHGLIGMRERTAMFGGTFTAGPRPGWRVPRPGLAAVGVIRVVLVDDQELVRTGFRLVLGGQPDMEVVGEAGDGAEAVEVVGQTRPDVVVMDVRMPRMDGVEATRRIRVSDDAPRVLILTTFDLDEYVYEAIKAGASGFLLKDTGAGNLIDGVRIVHSGDAVVAPSTTRRLLARFAASGPVWPGHGGHAGSAAESASPGAQVPAAGPLTARETEVLREVALGLSNAEIAGRMYLSEATVRTHVSSILGKLGLRGRVQAVVYAYEAGLVRPGA